MDKKTICYINRSAMGKAMEKRVSEYAFRKKLSNLQFITYDGVYRRDDVKEFMKMKHCENIILFSLDRMGRDTKENVKFLKFAKRNKVKVYIMREDFCFDHSQSKPFLKKSIELLTAFRKKEDEMIKERTKRGLAESRCEEK